MSECPTCGRDDGQNWEEQRKLALEKDFYQCRCCRMTQNEARQKYGEGLHVHHKTPVKFYDSPKQANRLRNLISLCKSCHHSLEWKHSGRKTVDGSLDNHMSTANSD